MRHIKIKILTILLLSTIWSFGQLTQAYKNGFVAATSDGIYYLMDGDNQWVNLGGINSIWFSGGTTDTVRAVSFNGKYLNGYTYCNIPSGYGGGGSFKMYGYNNYDDEDVINNYDLYSNLAFKNMTSKIRYDNGSVYFEKGKTTSQATLRFNTRNYNNSYIESIWSIYANLTSISSDNDTVVVCVGKNNTLINVNILSVNHWTTTGISGLVSSSLSGHQITYNPTDNLFYIVSDEGYVYTYDKTTVTKIKEIASYCDGGCDSVTDVAYNAQDSILYMGVVNGAGEKQTTLLYLNGANYGTVNQINYTSTADIQMTTNSAGKVLFNIDNGFYLYGKTSAKTLPSIPSGVTVYDLDYIDYLPFVDRNPPVITKVGADTSIVICSTYTDRGATATDDMDGNVTANIVTVNPVNNKLPGIYYVTYNVTDNAGNHATQVTRTVTVLNNFETVTINGQIWLKYNLSIDDGGAGIISPNNDAANDCSFGKLYNYAAAVRIAALVPGYHLPTISEWSTLMSYMGANGGGHLKESDYTYWDSPNTGADNSTGFSAMGAGTGSSGVAYNFKMYTAWWALYSSPNYVSYYLQYNNNYTNVGTTSNSASYYSVRLIKN